MLQCKANILQIANALESYKASNDFYIPKGTKAGTIGSPSNVNSYRIIARMGNNELLDFAEFNFIPELSCPLGGVRSTSVSGTVTIYGTYSYGLRLRQEEYSIRCFKHNRTGMLYTHLKDQPAGWKAETWNDNTMDLETADKIYYRNDSW